MMEGTVLLAKDNKLLVLSGQDYYILRGEEKRGDVVSFEPEKALIMPSYLFAIAAMEEDNLDETLDFIRNKWFTKQ